MSIAIYKRMIFDKHHVAISSIDFLKIEVFVSTNHTKIQKMGKNKIRRKTIRYTGTITFQLFDDFTVHTEEQLKKDVDIHKFISKTYHSFMNKKPYDTIKIIKKNREEPIKVH
jgi:acyl carrier protein phosphodiesterase